MTSEEVAETVEPFISIYRFDEIGLQQYIDSGADVDVAMENGETPLMLAVRRWPFAASMLIGAGANLDVVDADGRTPLHRAVSSRSLDGVRLLLKNGANFHVADNNGHTPFSLARDSTKRITALLARASGNR